MPKTLSTINKCVCGKKYKHRSSLSRHIKTCMIYNNKSSQTIDIVKLLSKNNELLSKLTSTNIINNYIQTNNINNDITFKIYLNENCQNAITLEKFAKNLTITLNDYMKHLQNGYVKGMGDVIVENLNNIEFNNRPIHCTDEKSEQFYIKNIDWEIKDKEEIAEQLLPLITSALLKNINKIWNEEYGLDWAKNDKATEEYTDTILILTKGNTKNNVQERLQAIDYVSKNIYVKIDNLLTNQN